MINVSYWEDLIENRPEMAEIMWVTYPGKDGWVHREKIAAITVPLEEFRNMLEALKKVED